MYIKRKIEADILKYLKRPEIIAIVGPRQAGKTTTLREIYRTLSNAIFLTFEDQQILSLFENNIKQFAQTYVNGKSYVFIDEFQYAKHGGKLLKYLYDLHHTKIIISGSSAVDLTIKAIKFLVGRVFVLDMHPFDFYEYLNYRDDNYAKIYDKYRFDFEKNNILDLALEQRKVLRDYYEEYALWGGYPQVVLSKTNEEKKIVLKNIYNTYFLREVKNILGLIDDFKLAKLIKALALQSGSIIEYENLSQVSELSFVTIKKYLNFLSKTYICDLVKPFYKNKKKEIVKSSKLYFFDTGLRNFILNDFRPFDSRTDIGALLENIFWAQLDRRGYKTKYWRDKNKNEIDFIIELPAGKAAAVEIKHRQSKCRNLPLSFVQDYKEALKFCGFLEGSGQINKEQIFIPLV